MYIALVVDDSPIELLMTKALLERLELTALTATCGEDALRLIHEHSPLVVICDINMPGMNGLELLEATRTLDAPPIFIMASGLDDAEHAVASLHKGAYGYLTKPLKEEPLRQALLNASQRRQKEVMAQQEQERFSKTDPLTGLLNKDEFLRKVESYANGLRKDGHPVAVFFINIDGLRYINNTFDYHEGDRVLQHVAGILGKSVRPTDAVARYSGDVFAMALPDIDPDYVTLKAQSITNDIEQSKIQLADREHSLTVSIGGALGYYPAELETLVNNADLALLLAKGRGRNQFYLYQAEDDAHRREFSTQFNNLETLKQAIKDRCFNMHFQPIVNLETGEAHHYEALIRMRDEAGNMLPPDIFIKVAENFGMATQIDSLVVTACIQKLAELQESGNPCGLAINLSGKSVEDTDLMVLIKKQISISGIDPTRIIFEITETAAFQNLSKVQQFMREIKKLGCRFALDDFGVGFSSFYYIKQLEIDYLKIDGSFIRNLLENENDRVFVQAMVQISRVFGMKVIAEWVENADVMLLLQSMGVNYGQGYHFGKPEPNCYMKPLSQR